MTESIILGAVQGMTEWLPVSSQHVMAFIKTNFLQPSDPSGAIQQLIFLRWGVFFAALTYFQHDIKRLLQAVVSSQKANEETKRSLSFIALTTIITGALATVAIVVIMPLSYYFQTLGKIAAFLMAILLLLAILPKKNKDQKSRATQDLNLADAVILGIAQGLSILPGLSRTGSTVTCFLLRRFDQETALRLSFMMGLPVMLVGNLILSFSKGILFSGQTIAGFTSAFVVSLCVIQGILTISKKIDFYKFTLAFALLFLIASSL